MGIKWTEEEKNILINNYNNLEKEDILKLLPDRNWGATTKMAQIMGIAKRYKNPNILLSNYKTPNEYIYHDSYCEIIVRNRNTKEEFLVKISNEDIDLAKKYKWFTKKDCNKIYIRASYRPERHKSVEVMLHRLLFDNPKDMVIDHINGNTLDNRRENLRCVTVSVNSKNKSVCRNNTGIIGIRKISIKSGDRYIATIQSNGIKAFAKTYKTLKDAKENIRYARDYIINNNINVPQYIIDIVEKSRRNKKANISKFNKFRNKILERDNYTCKGCNTYFEENTHNLHIHHIIPVSINSDLEYSENNCICLCRECHESIKGRELDAIDIFKLILQKEYNIKDVTQNICNE